MGILSLCLANLLRNRIRFLLALLGIAASTAVLFSIVSFHGGFDRALSRELAKTGVHFMVVPSGCPHEVASLILHGAVIPKFLDPSIIEKITPSEQISLVAPLLVFQSPNNRRQMVDIIYGLPMNFLNYLKPHWRITGEIPKADNEILLGYEIASHDGLKVGDRYPLGDLAKPLVVAGIVEKTGSQDDAYVYTSVKKAQEILKKEKAYTALAVQVRNPERLSEIIEMLTSQIPGIQIATVSQIMNSLSMVANSAKIMSLSIAVIAIIISAVGVMNTVLMAAFERRQETGMMRALGAGSQAQARLHCFTYLVVWIAQAPGPLG